MAALIAVICLSPCLEFSRGKKTITSTQCKSQNPEYHRLSINSKSLHYEYPSGFGKNSPLSPNPLPPQIPLDNLRQQFLVGLVLLQRRNQCFHGFHWIQIHHHAA